jgi:urocanate hydratase
LVEQSLRDAAGSTFQSRVFADYEAVHAALADIPLLVPPGLASDQKGALAGQFIVSDSLAGSIEPLPVASLLAGACFLGMDSDAEAARNMLRQGRCDFVVNTLDEALRILKNELRQRKPVAVCLTGEVPSLLQEMADRGVAPQLLFHVRSAREYPAITRLQDYGALLCAAHNLGGLLNRPPNADGELTQWTLPRGNAASLARVDAVAREVLPENDRKRRRWLEAAARYLPRELPPVRIASLTPSELERFADGVCARVMSRDVPGPVDITSGTQKMSLDAESAA